MIIKFKNQKYEVELNELEATIKAKFLHLRSLVICLDNVVEYEVYLNDNYNDGNLHPIASADKSFISAVVGIAIRQGLITSVHSKVLDFFPEVSDFNVNPLAKELTIKHLLTMSSGLNWKGKENLSKNEIILTLFSGEMDEPNTKFSYKPDPQIMIWILERVTGMSFADVACKLLFEPLGISEYSWQTDFNEYKGLYVRPIDLIKFGLLYLNKGVIQGSRLLDEHYIRESTELHNGGGFPEGQSYGYYWWLSEIQEYKLHYAGGFGGQYIFVVPELNLVVSITSDMDKPHLENKKLLDNIIPIFIR